MYGYRLYKNDEIVYVGLTINIERRIKCHKRTEKDFDNYTYLSFDNLDEAIKWERKKIQEHNPIYNVSQGCYSGKSVTKKKTFTTALNADYVYKIKLMGIHNNISAGDIIDMALSDFFENIGD